MHSTDCHSICVIKHNWHYSVHSRWRRSNMCVPACMDCTLRTLCVQRSIFNADLLYAIDIRVNAQVVSRRVKP